MNSRGSSRLDRLAYFGGTSVIVIRRPGQPRLDGSRTSGVMSRVHGLDSSRNQSEPELLFDSREDRGASRIDIFEPARFVVSQILRRILHLEVVEAGQPRAVRHRQLVGRRDHSCQVVQASGRGPRYGQGSGSDRTDLVRLDWTRQDSWRQPSAPCRIVRLGAGVVPVVHRDGRDRRSSERRLAEPLRFRPGQRLRRSR